MRLNCLNPDPFMELTWLPRFHRFGGKAKGKGRAAVGMGIPMGMGMVWVWGL